MKVVLFVGLASALFLAGCGRSAVPSTAPQTMGDLGSSTSSTQARQIADTDREPENDDDDNGSVLKTLDDMRTIGSTVDPVNGAQNPYGLDIAKTTSGNIRRGDLVVCNFNDAANVQGTGFSLIALHPHVGANPLSISRSKELTGCTALAMSPLGPVWAASFAENENPIVSGTGAVLNDLHNGPFNGPFGQAFAPHPTPFGAVAAFYESNAGDGSLVRINISPQGMFSFDVIAHGFPVNHGAPGGILGPSGLQYDKKHDRLFIVDGTNNAVYALRHVSTIPANGIVVNGTQFGGPFARRARVVFSGAPLNGPISSALLFNDNLVIGNTLDPNGENLMVEVTPHGKLLDVKNVDTGAAGALFGMVASGDGRGDTKLYFNDDNENTVKVLTR